MHDLIFVYALANFVGVVVLYLQMVDKYDWERINHDLWLREMRDKYPWPEFRL